MPGQSVTDLRLVPAAVACWLACALAVGAPSARWSAVAASAGAVTAVVTAVVGRRRGAGTPATSRGDRPVWTAWLAVVAATAALVSSTTQVWLRDGGLLAGLVAERAVVELVGVVRSEITPVPDPWAQEAASQAGGRYRAVLAVESLAGRGRAGTAAAQVLVLGGPEWRSVPFGTTVRVNGRLGPTGAGDDVRGMLTTWGPVSVLAPPGGADRAVAVLRTALLAVTDDLPPDARGLVPGAAVGDTSRVPADLEQAMRDVGLTHVTAVSGGHFAVLSMTVLALTGLLRLPRAVRALVSLLVMGGFVLLVHPEPSVVRAALMGVIAAAGMVAGRRSRAVPALAATVVVLLVLDPWLARSFGFVLSVVATGAIVLLAPRLAAVMGSFLPRSLSLAIAVPAAAQAASAPVIVLLDPAVSLVAVPANLLAAPALVPATLLGVAATTTAPWAPALATGLAQTAGVATWWIAAVARVFAALPGARQPWPEGWPGAVGLAALTLAVVVAVLLASRLGRRARRVWLVGLLCAALLLAPDVRSAVERLAPGAGPPRDWRLAMCDVGQGDALVLRSGPASAVVIDVGPDGDAAGDCLDDLGIRTIDLLVLTHHHADHVGGLPGVLDGRDVTSAVVSPLAEPTGQAGRTLEALAAAGVPVQVGLAAPRPRPAPRTPGPEGPPGPGGPDGLTTSGGLVGEVRWTVLGPPGGDASSRDLVAARTLDAAPADGGGEEEGSEVNDSSVVLLLEAPGLSVLALGDVEPRAQQALAADLPDDARRADVIKVAHHGSARQSAELAGLLRPALALVSAGADNTYGHPAPSTTAMLAGRGARVLTTVDCGRIVVGAPPGVDGVQVTARCLG